MYLLHQNDVGITVEHLNPSFLVKKPSGGFRLVTEFADVGWYSKPQPSFMPDVDSTLRKIGQWMYFIASDLTTAFYQIPQSHESMKYCGVVTPVHGLRVYTRTAMGMPRSETALEELICPVRGDMLVEGVSHCVESLWPHPSASKTTICRKTITILGWIWSQGTLRSSPTTKPL